jgi:hypothetical protein
MDQQPAKHKKIFKPTKTNLAPTPPVSAAQAPAQPKAKRTTTMQQLPTIQNLL